jgi:DNA-binding LacI/PurR family transcriptional regulator
MVTLKDVAENLGLDLETVRNILNETPGVTYDKALQDKVFRAARQLGYDLKKLKIGKRMEIRKKTIEDMILLIEKHPGWSREEILGGLRESIGLVKRVQKKTFPEEYPDEGA